MIIAQTPFRVSFFGGGTDWPEFFKKHGGAVLGSAIDHFLYHSATPLVSKLFDYSIRLAYSKVECVRTLDEIEHRPFREILRALNIHRDIEISVAADLPSFSGLGSSSSFTVGLLNALAAYQGRHLPKRDLAEAAIKMERDRLGEAVGCQDSVFAAYGGLNLVEFHSEDNITVNRVCLCPERFRELQDSMVMVFTGIKRRAESVEREKISRVEQSQGHLRRIFAMVEHGYTLLTGTGPLSAFGELLNKAWTQKRGLSSSVSNPQIDAMYDRGIAAGAIGGKLLGAGGGGFMLFFVPPEVQPRFRRQMADYCEITFALNAPGSYIVHSM
jgi:D-glycero-alpha-D-manno-heptose-7-phosphate kinase